MSIVAIRTLKDQELLKQTQKLVSQERILTAEILNHLAEIQRRRLFADLGYSSLFAYCVSELKYSHAQAQRRIEAMRLLVEIPEVKEKINEAWSSGCVSF